MVDAGFRCDSITSEAALTVLVGELHRRHAEVVLSREARRRRFGLLHERQRLGMRAQECLQWRPSQICRIARSERAQKLKKLITRPDRKTIGRNADDVGVNAFRQMESNRTAARIGMWIVIGNHWNTCRAREPDRYWRRR